MLLLKAARDFFLIELGRLLGEGAAIAQGIYEFIAGSAAVGGGGGLCITGIGCFAGAPAIATGVVLQAHGATLAVNSANEFGEKLSDIINPNRMASSGGADDVIGLSRETGISTESINKVYGDVSSGDIKLLGDKLGKNTTEHLFNKGGDGSTGSQLVKDVAHLIGRFSKNNDDIAIDSVKGIIQRNKNGKLSDSQAASAFSETTDFYRQYGNKVSGDFPTRFAIANETKGAVQSRNEIQVTKDLLEQKNTTIGSIDKVFGIPGNTTKKTFTTPDIKAIDTNGISRLVEIKTPAAKKFGEKNFERNIKGAFDQIKRAKEVADKNAYIIIDYTSQPAINISRSELENLAIRNINFANTKNNVEFVDVIYNNTNGNSRLLLKIKDGTIQILQ